MNHTGDFYDGCDSDREDLAHNFCAPDVCVCGFGVDGFLSAGHGTTGIFLPLDRVRIVNDERLDSNCLLKPALLDIPSLILIVVCV